MKPINVLYEIGCYGDGVRGQWDQNEMVIDLIDQIPNDPSRRLLRAKCRLKTRRDGIVAEYRAAVASLILEAACCGKDEDEIIIADEATHEIIDDAIDLLNEATDPFYWEDARLPYTRWGFNEAGDFGLWPAVEDVHDDALHTSDVIIDYDAPQFIVDVNDHGNMTLYAIERREIWSAV